MSYGELLGPFIGTSLSPSLLLSYTLLGCNTPCKNHKIAETHYHAVIYVNLSIIKIDHNSILMYIQYIYFFMRTLKSFHTYNVYCYQIELEREMLNTRDNHFGLVFIHDFNIFRAQSWLCDHINSPCHR